MEDGPLKFSLRTLFEAVLYICVGLAAATKAVSTNPLEAGSALPFFIELLIAGGIFGAAVGALLGRRRLFAAVGLLFAIAFGCIISALIEAAGC